MLYLEIPIDKWKRLTLADTVADQLKRWQSE